MSAFSPKSRSLPPLAPGGVPILGHIPLALRSRFSLIDAARSKQPISRLKLGPKKVFFISDYEDLQKVLIQDSGNFVRGVHFKKMRNMVGNGVVTTSGEEHRIQRSILLPAFTRRRLEAHVPVMTRAILEFVSTLPNEERWEPMGAVMSLGCKVVCNTIFGSNCPKEVLSLIQDAVPIFVKSAAIQALDFTGVYKHLPTRLNRDFNSKLAELDKYIYDIIDSRLQSGVADTDESMVGYLLSASDPNTGARLSRTEIRDQISTVLLASTETTANTVAWTLYELVQHPRIKARVVTEIDELFSEGLSPDAVPHLSREDLPLLKRCIQEALRLYPSSYLLSRETTEEVDLGGYLLPAGSEILYSHFGQQRDPRYFSHPDEFDPDRWLPEHHDEVTSEAYMPFGHGAYRCLGDNLALLEATYLIAVLLYRKDVFIWDRTQPKMEGNITLSPAGLFFGFKDRPMPRFGSE